MKALTISQPYASLIADGEKWIENRIWVTNFRGLLAIHAGKGMQYMTKTELKAVPSGCVIAIANMTACVMIGTIKDMALSDDRHLNIPGTSKTWYEASKHIHCEGPWCFILEDTRKISHYPTRGLRKLWEIGLSDTNYHKPERFKDA